jgi:hypothetical protein
MPLSCTSGRPTTKLRDTVFIDMADIHFVNSGYFLDNTLVDTLEWSFHYHTLHPGHTAVVAGLQKPQGGDQATRRYYKAVIVVDWASAQTQIIVEGRLRISQDLAFSQ